MTISIGKAELIGLLVETTCFGMLVVMFIITLYLLRRRSKRGLSYKLLALVLCTLFVLAAMHLAIDAILTVHAFTATPNADVALSNFGDAGYLTKSIVTIVQVAVGDAFLIYRLYLVWGRERAIIFVPGILWLAQIVTGAGIVYTLASFNLRNGLVFINMIQTWKVSYFALLITLNIGCPFLIAFRIWRTQYHIAAQSSLTAPLVIVIESGTIYSATVIVLLIEQFVGGNIYYSCLDPATSIIGIGFAMIIMRVNLGKSSDDYPSNQKLSHGPIDQHTSTLKPIAFSYPKTTEDLERLHNTHSI